MSISRASRIISLLLERRIEPVHYTEFERRIKVYVGRFTEFVKSDPIASEKVIQHLSYTHVTYDKTKGIMIVSVPDLGLVMRELRARLIELGTSSGWWLLEPTEWQRVTPDLRFAPNPHPGSDRLVSRIPPILFHAAPREIINKILSRGILLFPPGEDRYMGGGQFQVAYVSAYPENAIQVMIRKKYTRENIAVFLIHTDRLNHNTRFFYDPQFADSFYTNSPIPTSAIELFRETSL